MLYRNKERIIKLEDHILFEMKSLYKYKETNRVEPDRNYFEGASYHCNLKIDGCI